MCDPPTRPRPPSLLYGGRYSAEANAARAERWRALAALQTRGAETAGRKAHAGDATDAASAASVAACDAREALETELGTHDANATRGSQVVVPTPTPEFESEAETWAKRVPWSRVNVVRHDTERVADGGDSKKTEKDEDEDASALVATSVDFLEDESARPVPCKSPFVTARRTSLSSDDERLKKSQGNASLAAEADYEREPGFGVEVLCAAASPRRLFRLDSADDASLCGVLEEDEEEKDDCHASLATTSFNRDDWDARVEVVHDVARKETNETEEAKANFSAETVCSYRSWTSSSDDATTASSGWTSRSSSFSDDLLPRSALFSPFPVVCSRAFREAVEAVEREDERRKKEAERFVDWLVERRDDGVNASSADAENVDPEMVAAAAAMARADADVAADETATREKNAAAFAALRRSLELNSPPAPPPVRTRVAETKKKKKPLAVFSVPASARPSSSSRDAKRRRDEGQKTSWEPERTWPPLPAAEPDETAVAEEEAEAATAGGGGTEAKPDGDATKTKDEKQKETDASKCASSSSVWAAIVAAKGRDAAPTAAAAEPNAAETTEAVAVRRKDALTIPRAETLEVFEETTPADARDDAREEAKSLLEDDAHIEATRRRCEAAAVALEDAVRAALDARAAAAACAPGAAREIDAKMASSARILSAGGSLEALSDAARFFDAEECFAPGACVPGGFDKEHVPRVCRWRSAHGSSFALGPAVDSAAAGIDSEAVERAMERVVERCLAKFGDGIVRAVRASSQAPSQ